MENINKSNWELKKRERDLRTLSRRFYYLELFSNKMLLNDLWATSCPKKAQQ